MRKSQKKKMAFLMPVALFLLPGRLFAATPRERSEEIDRVEKIMLTKWSNREIHEKQDGVDIKKILGNVRKKANGSDEDYLAALYAAVDLFHDSHVFLFLPNDTKPQNYVSGLTVAPVQEGHALIRCKPPADCADLPFPILITQINGVPVEKWLNRQATTIGESTEPSRKYSALKKLEFYSTLRGRPSLKVISLLLPGRVAKKMHLKWKEHVPDEKRTGGAEPLCVSGKQHSSGTFVLTIETFGCRLAGDRTPVVAYRRFVKNMKAALKQAKGSDSLMLDVRENGGGQSHLAGLAGKLLMDEKMYFSTTRALNEDNSPGELQREVIEADRKWRKYFKGFPAAILSASGCGSVCGYFIVAVREAGLAMILGEPAVGSNGKARHFPLPASGTFLAVPIETGTTAADGKEIEGRTIDVDRRILPSMHDYKEDPDPILTEAIAVFRREKL